MKVALLALLIFLSFNVLAQNEDWDVYIADYDGKPGSIVVDMSLRSTAPIAMLKYIVITGVKANSCLESGFPDNLEFETLYKISDSVKYRLERKVTYRMAGTFTNNCERLDYFYVADTIGIRNDLETMYAERYKGYSFFIKVKEDRNWDGYLNFLYPNEVIYEYMSNQKVLDGLSEAGDELIKPRTIDHWAYFKSKTDREKFKKKVSSMGFSAEESNAKGTDLLKYSLMFSRVDKVDIKSISALTVELKKIATSFQGEYDGWETVVIR